MGRRTTISLSESAKSSYNSAKDLYIQRHGKNISDSEFIEFLSKAYLEFKEAFELNRVKELINEAVEEIKTALSKNMDFKQAFYDVLERMRKLEEENAKLKTELDLKMKEIEELKNEIVKLKTSVISTTSRKELLSKALFEYAQIIRSNYSNYLDIYSEFIDLILSKVFIDDDRVDVDKIESIVNALMW